jgi:hypothetical protein
LFTRIRHSFLTIFSAVLVHSCLTRVISQREFRVILVNHLHAHCYVGKGFDCCHFFHFAPRTNLKHHFALQACIWYILCSVFCEKLLRVFNVHTVNICLLPTSGNNVHILFIASSPVQCSKLKIFNSPITAYLKHTLPEHSLLVACLIHITYFVCLVQVRPARVQQWEEPNNTNSSLTCDWFMTQSARDGGRHSQILIT